MGEEGRYEQTYIREGGNVRSHDPVLSQPKEEVVVVLRPDGGGTALSAVHRRRGGQVHARMHPGEYSHAKKKKKGPA